MKTLLLLVFSLCAAAQTRYVEWVAVPFDPPGTLPQTFWRAITIQKSKPTKVDVILGDASINTYMATVEATLMPAPVFSVAGVQIGAPVWCLINKKASLLSVALELAGSMYTFNVSSVYAPQDKPTGLNNLKAVEVRGCQTALLLQNELAGTPRVLGVVNVYCTSSDCQ